MSVRQLGNIVWEDIVISILAVNRYSLEKAYGLLNSLREEGFFEPQNLIKLDEAEISRRLNRAGYSRGPYLTGLFAKRLAGIGGFISTVGIDEFEKTILSGSRADITNLLKGAPGVGPVVLENVFTLRGIR